MPLRAVAVAVTLLLGSFSTWHGTSLAQTIQQGGIIEEVRVEGTQRIEPETVRSYLRLNPGDPFDLIRLDQSLKSIFSTGLFADVTLRRERNALIVTVVENPIVNRIAFEGNERIDDETLGGEIDLQPRVVFTRTKVQNDVKRIVDLYRRSGRFGATVDPKIIELPQNRVDLAFEINEGPKTEIIAINFVGNRAFSDSTLRDQITTTETAFWRILSSTDTYDPDRLTFDRELLRRFYLNEGYADIRVVSAIAELTPDRSGFIITFTVEEGERYTVGAIDITTSLRNLDPEILREDLVIEEGDWYDASLVEASIENLTERLSNLGFAFVDVNPRLQRDRDTKVVAINFEIREGPKVYVERIDIQGNLRTLDKVIRREFLLIEGDAFNSARLRRSRQRIQNLGFFSRVDVSNEPGTRPDSTVITVEVEEQSTGDLSFGAGFSTTAGPIGNVGLRERNLLGGGQDLRLNFAVSADTTRLNLSFTEPYFLDRNLSAGFDVFRLTSEQSESSFDEERIGGSLRAGYDIVEDLRQVVRYSLAREELEDADDGASLLVIDDLDTYIVSSINQELSYDKRDSRFDPREGYAATVTNEFVGLGGDLRFLKNTIGGSFYFPLFGDVTWTTRAEGGLILPLGEDTRVSDRFFIGPDNLRGFEFAGVGPRDAASSGNDALGGKKFYSGTAEISFPLGLPEEFQIRGRLFTDIGASWDVDGDTSRIELEDSSSPRVSVGGGFSWNSPFGPIQVDLGFAVIKEEFDETEVLNFSFGTRF
ncbi:MAG: outer membrane protein assembly factor BamA [Kiloniellales bacterium]|nr:outer membrane protein assembly factor BamA [Kiloniellales bacterium]